MAVQPPVVQPPVVNPPPPTIQQNLTDNLWAHVGAVVAVGIGLVDLWHFHSLGTVADQIFIIGGLAAFGINVAAPQNKV